MTQLQAMKIGTNSTIQRHDWTQTRTVREVLQAAKSRRQFHETRARTWKGKRAKTERGLKKHGIKIVPDLYNNQQISAVKYSGVRHERVDVDRDLLMELNNQNEKVEEHKQRARDYAKFVAFLEYLDPGEELRLTLFDAEYFGLVTDTLEGEGDE